MWAALGKAAVGAVKGGAKKIATDKLMNRKKKTDARRAAAQKMMGGEEGGEEKGGAIVVQPKAALVQSPAGAIEKYTGGDQQQSGGGEDLQGLVLRIKTSTIQVESLLGNSVALQKKQIDDARKAREAAQLGKAEADLEKKKPKTKSKGPKINIPGKGILSSIMDFIINIAFGWIAVRLVDFAPQLGKILPAIGAAADFIINWGGKILNGLATLIHWGYKFVEMGKGLVKNVFGEEGAKKFDNFMSSLKNLISGFLIWKLIGEKIFKAIVQNIKNTFNVIKSVFAKAGKFLNWMTGGRAGNLAKNVLGKGKNLVGNIGRRLGVGAKRFAGKGVRSLVKGAGKGAKSIMKKGLGKAAKRGVIKMFGKTAGKIFGKIPIIGPVIVGIISLMSGEPLGQALFKTLGAAVGGLLGTFIPIPVVGTLLGEAIGVFVGDLLYHLIVKRDPKAAFKMLKDTVMGIFKGGKAIFNWVAGGFGRFYEGIPKIKIPDFPKDAPDWVPDWVPFKEKLWKALTIGFKVMMGPLSLLMGREIPNLLWLYNPMNTAPLLFKSFFPPKGAKEDSGPPPSLGASSGSSSSSSGDSAEDLKAKEKARKEEEKARKKEEAEKKRAEMKAKIGKTIGNVKDKVGGFFKNVGKGIKSRVSAAKGPKKSIDNKIASVSKKASYEKHHHQVIRVPIVVKTGAVNANSSKPVVVGSGTGGGGDNPYEVLDFQG